MWQHTLHKNPICDITTNRRKIFSTFAIEECFVSWDISSDKYCCISRLSERILSNFMFFNVTKFSCDKQPYMQCKYWFAGKWIEEVRKYSCSIIVCGLHVNFQDLLLFSILFLYFNTHQNLSNSVYYSIFCLYKGLHVILRESCSNPWLMIIQDSPSP